MAQTVEINQGEIKIKFNEVIKGKVSLKELGIEDSTISLESGLLRLVFDMEGIGEHQYFQVPTITIVYNEEVGETHWQCDFNGETIVDKTDHHGHSTVILLNLFAHQPGKRKKKVLKQQPTPRIIMTNTHRLRTR